MLSSWKENSDVFTVGNLWEKQILPLPLRKLACTNVEEFMCVCFILMHLVSLSQIQRDLDFTIDLDFKGQLCELSCSTDYRMR